MYLCGPQHVKAPHCSEGLSLSPPSPPSTLIMRVTGDIFLQSFLLHTETPSWIVLINLGALLACDQSQQTDRQEGR